jgi:tellurite resistance protein
VLGLAGLANDWHAAAALWGLPAIFGKLIFMAALAAWGIVSLLYGLKWIVAVTIAREEAGHAVQCCFIGLAGVATLLIAQGALAYSRPLAVLLFALGATVTIVFALWRTGHLWRGDRDPASTTAVLYLPMVAGGFVTGIVAASLGWQEAAQLAFGAAFFTWLAVESVLLHRLYTAPPLAPALRPTLGIQLAPPAVGAVCYLAVGGGNDLVAHMLVGYAVLQALLLARMARWIADQPFGPSYWAFTFGATALAGASMKLSAGGGQLFAILAPIFFILANLLVAGIAAGTIGLLLSNKLLPSSAS